MRAKPIEEVATGIYLEPVPITVGDEVRIKYKGDLVKNNTDQIYLHTGYGYQEWRDVQDVAMQRTGDGGWMATLQITDHSCLNFCFHDSAMNWDNNNGRDWTYEIHEGHPVRH
ncbi:MAG TPA: carbohydrate-binding protein [Bacillota bacterium]